MVTALVEADYRFIAIVCLTTVLWLLVRSQVWRTLLQEGATYHQVFFTINEGYLLNNVLPFRLGEIARAFLLARKAGLEFWQVFSTILIERALDLVMTVGLLLITLPFVVGAGWAYPAAIMAGCLVLTGLYLLYLLARHQGWAVEQFEKLAARWPILNKFGERYLPAFLSGLTILTDGKRFLKAIAWMLVNWGISIVQFYFLILAFFPESKLLWAAFTLGVMALGIAAPSSPGGLGPLQLAVVGALSVFSLDPSKSLALAITAQFINMFITGILGTYGLMEDGETLTGLYRSVRHLSKDATT